MAPKAAAHPRSSVMKRLRSSITVMAPSPSAHSDVASHANAAEESGFSSVVRRSWPPDCCVRWLGMP